MSLIVSVCAFHDIQHAISVTNVYVLEYDMVSHKKWELNHCPNSLCYVHIDMVSCIM